MFNDFQWNCFNLIYTCNIALILFLKCDVTKFRIPPSCHTSSIPSPPLTCDEIYGRPLSKQEDLKEMYNFINNSNNK